MKNYICITLTTLLMSLIISTEVSAYKYGLGSCLDQRVSQDIWSSIQKENIDGFIFLGDNVYGDTPSGKLSKMKRAYEIQQNKLPKWLMEEKEILAIWDDHDYGMNDGGADYPYKKEAENLFLNFWKIPNSDPRKNREGIYFNQVKEIEGILVEIIGLDTRYFRSKLEGKKNAYKQTNNPEATILGKDQWMWLETSIKNSDADVIIILSSIQILATNHPYEKWDNFPLERARLLELIADASKKKTVLAVSGDRHRSGIYQNEYFIEITSSSLNKSASKNIETDPLLIGETYPEESFGIMEIQPNKNQIILSIHDQHGMKLNSTSLRISP